MRIWFVLSLLFFCSICFGEELDYSNGIIMPLENISPAESFKRAYLVFLKNGDYDEKLKMVKVFDSNYTNGTVIDMTIDLLDHFYDHEDFAENDQIMYYDDVIAGDLVKILAKSGSKKGFPALLKIALHPSRHRDETVKEAWKGLEEIKW